MTDKLTTKQQSKKGNGSADKKNLQSTREVSETTVDPINDLRAQAELAYNTYLEAQRKVARAYREFEQKEVNAHRQAAVQASNSCDRAIQQSMRIREKAEWEAEETYREAREKVAKAYKESVAQALRVCWKTIEQAWERSTEVSDRVWKIFQGDETR